MEWGGFKVSAEHKPFNDLLGKVCMKASMTKHETFSIAHNICGQSSLLVNNCSCLTCRFLTFDESLHRIRDLFEL